MIPLILPILALLVAASTAPAESASSAPAPARNASAKAADKKATGREPARTDLQSFRIIADRNIFNASRSGGYRGTRNAPQRVVKVDYYKLLGTLSYEKGRFALFDGSSSQFKKSLSPGDSIGQHKIADVGPNSIKLVSTNGHVIDFKIGMRMRRQDNGPWELGGSDVTASSSASSGSSSTPTAATTEPSSDSGAMSDVMKRLMQKRAEQLNK